MLKIVVCILSTFMAAVCANRLPLSANIAGRADHSLGNFLLTPQARASAPESAECFHTYMPVMQQALTQWSLETAECWEVAKNDSNAILERASQSAKDITTEAASVCDYVETCDAANGSLATLDCLGSWSSNSLSTIYLVSNNASDLAAKIREQFAVIDTNTYKCCNASERSYVETIARLTDAMNNCFIYGPPPTVAPPSDAVVPVASNARRDIQLVSAPRRTPFGRALTKEAEEAEANPEARSNLVAAFNNWLQQNENRGAPNV